jgi:hypothetical protein
MDNAITYCVNCTTEIDADATTCPACGAQQKTGNRTPAGGQTTAPAGWQAGRPAASETGYTIEEP